MRQMRSIVMLKMRFAIDAIRKPYCKRRETEQSVDKRRTGRVTVQQFMLQGHVPGTEYGEQEGRQWQAELARVYRHTEPSPVDDNNQQPRRPLSAPCPACCHTGD